MFVHLWIGLPHSFRWLVSVILIELWNAEHGFNHQCKQTEQFYEVRRSNEDDCDYAGKQSEQWHKLNVTEEISPLPEIFDIQVYKCNKYR